MVNGELEGVGLGLQKRRKRGNQVMLSKEEAMKLKLLLEGKGCWNCERYLYCKKEGVFHSGLWQDIEQESHNKSTDLWR